MIASSPTSQIYFCYYYFHYFQQSLHVDAIILGVSFISFPSHNSVPPPLKVVINEIGVYWNCQCQVAGICS